MNRPLREKPVATLEGLLERLYCEWGSNKFSPVLHAPGLEHCAWVEENFEHRHMTTSTSQTDVEGSVFREAQAGGYIVGEPMWGGRSTIDFVITPLGVDRYEELRDERLAAKKWAEENWIQGCS